jgi:hypothetical protein
VPIFNSKYQSPSFYSCSQKLNISNRNERYPGPGSYISFSEFGILDPNFKKRGRLQTEPSKNKETEPEQTKNEDNYEDFGGEVEEKPKLKETRKSLAKNNETKNEELKKSEVKNEETKKDDDNNEQVQNEKEDAKQENQNENDEKKSESPLLKESLQY